MSPVSKRSLPKKQKLTGTGKNIPNLKYTVDCYTKNGLNEQENKLNSTEDKQSKEKHKTKVHREISQVEKTMEIKTELIENDIIEKNVHPGFSGSSGSELVPGFVSEFSEKLNDHLTDTATKISSLQADLKFSKQVIEKAKDVIKNERTEKQKIAKELSELRKIHNNLLEETKTTQSKLVEENTSLRQQLTTSRDACSELKNGMINYIFNFNPLDKDVSSEMNSNSINSSDMTDSNVSNAEPTVSISSDARPQDTDNDEVSETSPDGRKRTKPKRLQVQHDKRKYNRFKLLAVPNPKFPKFSEEYPHASRRLLANSHSAEDVECFQKYIDSIYGGK